MKATHKLIAPLLLLTACSHEVEDAQRELDMAKNAQASSGERCVAEKKLEAAYLHAHDESTYKIQKNIADTECMLARLGGDGAGTVTDNISELP